jgi:hypothetical protein
VVVQILFVVAALGALLLIVAALSSSNPFLAMGANNRLESRCPAVSDAGSWTYDRSTWTPLMWSCTVETPEGARRIRAW